MELSLFKKLHILPKSAIIVSYCSIISVIQIIYYDLDKEKLAEQQFRRLLTSRYRSIYFGW